MPSYQRHVFVCIHERAADDPRGCCKARGGSEIRDRIKKELKNHGMLKTVGSTSAGCLGQCVHGVTIVVYPEQVWYGNVTMDDVSEIVQSHLIFGRIVKRLLLEDQPHLEGVH